MLRPDKIRCLTENGQTADFLRRLRWTASRKIQLYCMESSQRRNGKLKYMPPASPAPCARQGARVHPTRRCGPGGYTIRPYGPACGFLVGAGPDSRRGTMVLLAVGARIARPLATRMQSTSPIAAGVGRHAHMPPCRVHRPKVLQKPHSVPDAPCAPLRRVCSARVLPTREHGRIYNPPLRIRLRFPRRGGS